MDNPPDSLPRTADSVLHARMRQFPVTVVTGARQTGKTTLVRTLIEGERRYVTFDELATLEVARQSPDAVIGDRPLIVDEVQRVPDFLLAVKQAVDTRRTPGRFVLTGSANLLLLKQCSESLAGRATHLVLRPLAEREKRRRPTDEHWSALISASDARAAEKALTEIVPVDWRAAALAGGFPVAALDPDPESRARWFDGYVDTYLHRDLRELAQVADLPAFLRLVRLAALRTGGLLNAADLASDAKIPRATVVRWLGLLETSCLLILLQPFFESAAKRLIKTPKLYALDTGLGLHLTGVRDAADFDAVPQRGVWLENLVLNDLLIWRDVAARRPEIFFMRTADGAEIDFVVESGRRLLPIEVKAADAARVDDAKVIERFCEEFGARAPFGIVLHTGTALHRLSAHTLAVPLGCVL